MTEQTLRISDSLELPIDAAVSRFVILGKSGAGKTNADTVIAEEIIKVGIPVFILDPLGNMYGLRTSGDGEHEGLPVVLFGGAHSDLEVGDPIDMAKRLARERVPAVIDLSAFDLDAQRSFAEEFCIELMSSCKDVAHVIIEEADRFAPNNIGKNGVKTFARTARNNGIGYTFSTQRGQILSPEIIESSGAIVAMKMTGGLAQEAIGKEVASRTDGKKTAAAMIQSLAAFKRGDAWFIPDPDWLGNGVEWGPIQFQFRLRETFDSARPPSIHDKRREPKAWASVNLDAFRSSSPTEDTEHYLGADDAADSLHVIIAEHEGTIRRYQDDNNELARRLQEKLTAESAEFVKDMAAMEGRASRVIDAFKQMTGPLMHELESLGEQLRAILEAHQPEVRGTSELSKILPDIKRERDGLDRLVRAETAGAKAGLRSYDVDLLRALVRRLPAQWTNRAMFAALAGKSRKSSTFEAAVAGLLKRGFIRKGHRDEYGINPEGLKAIGATAPAKPMTHDDALLVWGNALGKMPSAILTYLAKEARGPQSREQISKATGFSNTSSSFDSALRELRQCGVVTLTHDRRMEANLGL